MDPDYRVRSAFERIADQALGSAGNEGIRLAIEDIRTVREALGMPTTCSCHRREV